MPRRILIVDDHPSFRGMARALLESEGFEVVGEASDGASAIEAARALRPDAILLDVQLPDIDGFEVATTVLSSQNGNAPAIVMTSSRDASDFGSLVEESGARGFIPKAELSAEAVSALLE
jgi:DNA-binding NarL/FixJ family response regulator